MQNISIKRGLRTAVLTVTIARTLVPVHAVSQESLPSVDQTRAEFELVCKRLTEGENKYFGEQIVTDLLQRISQSADPLVGILLRRRAGFELIRVGRHQEALDLVGEALELVRETPMSSGRGEAVLGLFRLAAIAHLQLAEAENCLANHTAESCILPIRPGAVHTLPRHARASAEALERVLTLDPGDPSSRWLLNLTRMLTGDYPERVPEQFRLPADQGFRQPTEPTWKEIGWRLGVNATDLAGGAIMDDFDGDGLLDLVTSSWGPCDPMQAFRNDGKGGFEDVGAEWGLDGQLGGLNISPADFDGDGDLDILVLRGAWLGEDGRIRNSLLRNDLDRPAKRFVDVTAMAGMAYPVYPTQNGAWADFDLDGDLDVFIGNEATGSSRNLLQLFGAEGNPYPSQLFRNNGDGTFTDVARQAGVQNRRFTKGSAWGDFDDDGDPDLYVSNIGPNRLYRNNGDATFTEVTSEVGVDEPVDISFAAWFFDFDNDGDLDLFVARFNVPVRTLVNTYFGVPAVEGGPLLYLNEGGRFRDISADVGLVDPHLAMGANYGDLDNDGWLDLYLGTGTPGLDALMPNAMYRNDGAGRFEDVTFETGLGHLQKGHGVAFGDIDNDGEQELFEQLGGFYPYDTYGNVLYENPGSDNRWLTLRLRGTSANTMGVGARIEVKVRTGDGTRSIHVLAGSGGSFGGSSMQQEIGLGSAQGIEWLAIEWPAGDRQVWDDVAMDSIYDVVEERADLIEVTLPRIDLGQSVTHHSQQARDP